MEHKPHVGLDYASGIGGKKIAIMGYSHWSDEPDDENFTVGCIKNVVSGDWYDLAFFNHIAAYFGVDHERLWRNSIFLNSLPRMVGGGKDRFASGSDTDKLDGQRRVMNVLGEHEPDLLLVFSRKAWNSLPKTLEDQRGESGTLVLHDQHFDRHHYKLPSGHVVQAVGLRHTQGADKSVMKAAVASALAMQANPPVA